MRVLMLVWTDVATDTRVLREATALVDAGHTVHVVGRHVPADYVPPPGVGVFSAGGTSALKRASGDVSGRRLSGPERAARWALLPTHVEGAHRAWVAAARAHVTGGGAGAFDVVHAHDFSALPLGAELAVARGVPYVYDTHEYWYGRPRSGRPTPVRRARERAVERRLGAAAAAVITVGPGVAGQLRADFGWPHVEVVRNTFPRSTVGPRPPGDPVTGLVYAGRIAAYRELETIVTAARALEPLQVTLVGPADPTYLAAFDPGPTTVMGPVPVAEVDDLLRAAGLALVTHSDRWANHRLALPNKLFHAVHAGVPVVAADVGELADHVRRYGLGTLYRPGDPGSLEAAARAAVSHYAELSRAVEAAADELSWEHDRQVLVDLYGRLG